jgi:hypothetical protein
VVPEDTSLLVAKNLRRRSESIELARFKMFGRIQILNCVEPYLAVDER